MKKTRKQRIRLNVGALIRKSRIREGMTLKVVAKALGVSIAYVSDIERGDRTTPKPERLQQLARIVKMPKSDVAQLFQEAGCLPPTVQQHVLKSPLLWGVNGARLIRINKRIVEWAMTHGVPQAYLAEMNRALTPAPW